MKRYFVLVMAAVLLGYGLTGCGTAAQQKDDTIEVVATIFPEYDWVKNILGDNPAGVEVTMLLDNGVDLHSYQPTAEDILKISSCDLFLYVGGESDTWVEDALKEAVNPDMVTVNLLEVLGDAVKEEEIAEGMQEEEDSEEESEQDEVEYDEHVWLSLKNASIFIDSIEAALEQLDAEHADNYKSNALDYQEQLAALDQKYQDTVDKASVHTLLFGDRFPFRYLVDDYGLDYYAAFAGCSAETEASFETVTFLAGKVNELSLPAILTIDSSDQRIAKTIQENTKTKDQKILIMDSMQSVTAEDVQNGTTYLSIMESNRSILKTALE